MAGRPAKKAPQPPQPSKPAFDEFVDDSEGLEEDVPNLDAKGNLAPNARSRDWRDVERYVIVGRSDNDWRGGWWFAGLRK